MASQFWHRRSHTVAGVLCIAGFVFVLATTARAQQAFQFYLAATDESGNFVTNLTTDDIGMSENGQPAKTVKVEPFSVPIKLTIAVDNNSGTQSVFGNIRDALGAFAETLPEGMEVSVVTMAPQPRMHVRPTTDRQQIAQGLARFNMDSNAAFSDSIVEYADRVTKDKENYIPVLVIVTTTANEASSVQPAGIEAGLKQLVARGAKVYVFNTVTELNNRQSLERLDQGRQKVIGTTATQATGGRYEAFPIPAQLQEALPALGRQLAAMHKAHTSQFLVTVERPAGSGPQLNNPQFRLRTGLQGNISIDGRIRDAFPPTAATTP